MTRSLNGQIFRYLLVGVANTAIHLGVVYLFNINLGWSQFVSNTLAFLAASTFSFLVNVKWSFQSSPNIRNFGRFQLVATFGLIVSGAMGYLGDHFGWHYLFTVILIAATVSCLSFLLHRSYTFK